jgi:hypothetical protein
MRKIPVDQSRIRLIGTGKSVGRAQYAKLADGSSRRVPDAQETNEHGVPIWVIDALLDDPSADRAEICSVKVPAVEEPVTAFGEVLTFVGLVALPYVANGSNRVTLSFSADGIERPAAQGKSQSAA